MKAIVLKIYFLMMAASCVAQANVRGILSSQFLARGEQAVFEIRFDEAIEVLPVISEIKDVVVESLGYGRPQMMPGRRIESSYQFSVSSYAVGVHEIPPVEVIVSGKRLHTKAMRFEIFDPNDLKWQEVDSKPEGGGDTIRYASIIKIPDRKYYENQSMETEIKIYVPTQLAGAVVD
ncbi:MAG: hypothetical protein IZT59_03495, partial [Verrucomicrobia bacterium]|nr:hypothetical protein [Verrucomicrobiota bacterium]